ARRQLADGYGGRRRTAHGGRRAGLLHELCPAAAGGEPSVPEPYPGGGARFGAGTRRLELYFRGGESIADARAHPSPCRVRLQPAEPALRGRVRGRVRGARRHRRRCRVAPDLAGGDCPKSPGVPAAGREAPGKVCDGAGPYAASQARPSGGPQCFAQRDGNEDLCARQCPRLAALYRAAGEPARRGRDPEAGSERATDHAAGGAAHFPGLSAGAPARRNVRGGYGASEGLTHVSSPWPRATDEGRGTTDKFVLSCRKTSSRSRASWNCIPKALAFCATRPGTTRPNRPTLTSRHR